MTHAVLSTSERVRRSPPFSQRASCASSGEASQVVDVLTIKSTHMLHVVDTKRKITTDNSNPDLTAQDPHAR
jgi:hypothetical protein